VLHEELTVVVGNLVAMPTAKCRGLGGYIFLIFQLVFITMILSFFSFSANSLEFGRASKKCPSPQTPSHFLLASRSPAPCPNTWRAEQQIKKHPFLFQKESGARKSEKQGVFFIWCPPRLCEAGGGAILRAYDLVSSHHARGARDIIYFENRF